MRWKALLLMAKNRRSPKASTPKPYVPLTKKDLSGFDREVIALLLWAQDQGGRIRITNNGHAFVYGPENGPTTTIAPKGKKQNRGAENTRANLSRIFGRPTI